MLGGNPYRFQTQSAKQSIDRFPAHMWFDNVIVDADTTEDQSGTKHDKVRKKDKVLGHCVV